MSAELNLRTTGRGLTQGDIPARFFREALQRDDRRLIFRPELEAGYVRYKDECSIWLLRLGCSVGVALYAGFFLLDFVTQQRLIEPVIFIISFAIAWPATLLPAAATFIPSWRRHARAMAVVATALNGAALIACLTISARAGKLLPYEVLLLNQMFVFYLSAALFQVALPLAFAIVAVYLASAAWFGLPAHEYADQAFVLLAATLLGGIFCYLFERTERRSWLRAQLVEDMAVRDELTQLYNRRHLYAQGVTVLGQARHESTPCGLLLLDVDHFKSYNDSQGHAAGDRCLIRIGRALLKGARRPLDVVARNGGEEFAILLYDIAPPALLEHAEQLRQAVRDLKIPHPASPQGLITISIGAVAAAGGEALDGLMAAADRALYQAKHAGRDCVKLAAAA